jgi:hypothetical protein
MAKQVPPPPTKYGGANPPQRAKPRMAVVPWAGQMKPAAPATPVRAGRAGSYGVAPPSVVQRAKLPAAMAAAVKKPPAKKVVAVAKAPEKKAVKKAPKKKVVTHLFHATSHENAFLIVRGVGLEPRSGGGTYLCMSASEKGATTLERKATDVIFCVSVAHLTLANWHEEGAGEKEWRGTDTIPIANLIYRRYLNGDGWHPATQFLARN